MYQWVDVTDVNDARRKFDRGTHELAQRKLKNGGYVQLIQKRRGVVARKPYFVRHSVDEDGVAYTVPMY